MNFLFAWRYFKSKKSTNAINIIAYISVIAITVGAAALIIVLSVFNGFESLVKNLYSDFYADIKISPAKGQILQLNSQQLNTIKANANIAAYTFVVEEKALLKNGNNQATVLVKGVDTNYAAITNIAKHVVHGSFEVGTAHQPEIVMGAGIENATGIFLEQVLEKPVLFLPNKSAVKLNNLNDAFLSYNVMPTGTFVVQQEFDNKYIFTNKAFMQFMLNLDSSQYSYSEIKLKTNTDKETAKTATLLQKNLGENFIVQTRYEQNKSLYSIMKMEKWIIYGILSLILIVAAFNMIGALTMLVLEKQKDIAILKAMGANNNTIKNIFINNGIILAMIGSLTGIALATIICWLQVKFKLLKLGGSFVVDYYPVEIRWQDFILVLATVFVIALLASYLPARKAGKQILSLKS